MSHELVSRFAAAGLPLCHRLCEMLNEHPVHRTDRRGCGLTQATRLLSVHINRPRDPLDVSDLALLDGFPLREAGSIAALAEAAGWAPGWRRLEQAPAALMAEVAGQPGGERLLALGLALRALAGEAWLEESALVFALIHDLLSSRSPALPALRPMAAKPEVGSCSQAEEFFLEIARGKVRRGGHVNIYTDAAGEPVLVEKMGIGESHSAMLVRPATLCGVALPPGSLLALRHHGGNPSAPPGRVQPLDAVAAAWFLRITTLAVPPAVRKRAFSCQYERQLHANMMSPHTTTIDDLRRYADERAGVIA